MGTLGSGQYYKASMNVNYDSRVVICERKIFMRLATGYYYLDIASLPTTISINVNTMKNVTQSIRKVSAFYL